LERAGTLYCDRLRSSQEFVGLYRSLQEIWEVGFATLNKVFGGREGVIKRRLREGQIAILKYE
jgi:hypothetical protein